MMTVTLPEDLESQLQAEASRRGMQAVEYAVSLIRLARTRDAMGRSVRFQ